MYMDLSPALGEFESSVIMMYTKNFLGVVFEEICHSGLEILLDNDGIVIHPPNFFRDTAKRDWRISRDISSVFQ